nr:histidine phosphatase family protein [Paenibacillus xerothermodurans]
MRHGEPNWAFKDERNLQGALRDFVPLTGFGVRQAEQVIYNHKHLENCDLILSSPYTRSLQTAAYIKRNIGLPLKVEFDLHEWTPDNFQAPGINEIQELMKDYTKHNGVYPPGESKLWESKESVLKRVINVLDRYLDKSKVIVVCHSMVITTLLELKLEVEFCGVFEYEII